MKYVLFLTRQALASYNSLHMWVRQHNIHPDEVFVLHTDDAPVKEFERIVKMIVPSVSVKSIKISQENLDDVIKALQKVGVYEKDVVDITGARRHMVLALMGIKCRVVFLHLRNYKYSNDPLLLRPPDAHRLLEVSL